MKVMAAVTIPDSSVVGLDPQLSSLGGIFSEVLKYSIVFAGLAMFGYLIAGGFQLLTSGGDQNKIKAGTDKITFAIVGFLVVFSTYWIIQIAEVIFNLQIL